jgi:hypothetical protein
MILCYNNIITKEDIMFYHGTTYNFKKGFSIIPKNEYTSNESTKNIEDLFEEVRPSNKISRRNSVYLCDSPENIDNCGGYTDVIYEVSVEYSELSDLAWYSKADEYLEINNIKKARECAEKYWSGEIFEITEQSCYEIRTNLAKVLNVFELNVDIEDLDIPVDIVIEQILKNKELKNLPKNTNQKLTK